jgi:hypothetical protein
MPAKVRSHPALDSLPVVKHQQLRLQAREPGTFDGYSLTDGGHHQATAPGSHQYRPINRDYRMSTSYRVRLGSETATARPVLALPDKPSIAIMPFQNMSGDAEQEYFADGIVEEIITALSRFHGLFVIARNSSLAYKGRAVDVKQVGRELRVGYVLEGSVRKAGNGIVTLPEYSRFPGRFGYRGATPGH